MRVRSAWKRHSRSWCKGCLLWVTRTGRERTMFGLVGVLAAGAATHLAARRVEGTLQVRALRSNSPARLRREASLESGKYEADQAGISRHKTTSLAQEGQRHSTGRNPWRHRQFQVVLYLLKRRSDPIAQFAPRELLSEKGTKPSANSCHSQNGPSHHFSP